MEDNKDVDSEDLYAELEKAMKGDQESEEEKPQVASDQNSEEAPEQAADENGELSEEEISKLSPRAQKRIREQAAKIKELAEGTADKTPEPTPEEELERSQDFKNVKEFLNAVEDEPSRKLLESFYNVVKGEINTTLSPIEQKNNETLFESEFTKYEGIEGLADHKADLKKTFMRNPSQSMKALIGETVTDLQMNKIKPIESSPSSPNREKVDVSTLSKDELYDLLESGRE